MKLEMPHYNLNFKVKHLIPSYPIFSLIWPIPTHHDTKTTKWGMVSETCEPHLLKPLLMLRHVAG